MLTPNVRIITPPTQFYEDEGKSIMLAACPGGPGMNFNYLNEVITPFPSLGIDWLRNGQVQQLEIQVEAFEAGRQQAKKMLGQEIKLIPVCHSAGGPRGVLWAARHPEYVSGIILIDAIVVPPALPYSPVNVLLHLWRYRLTHLRTGRENAFRAIFMPQVSHYYFVQPTEEQKEIFTASLQSPFWELLLNRHVTRWHVQEELLALQVPILFIHGAMDRMISPEVAKRQQERLGDRATVAILEGTGHMPMIERPQAVIGFISQFLEKQVLSLRQVENQNEHPPSM